MSVHSYFPIVAVIGFEMVEYSVSESDGMVTVDVLVLEGSLRTVVLLELSTINGSALCESMLLCFFLFEKCRVSHFWVSGMA